jgi:hypothetical protein
LPAAGLALLLGLGLAGCDAPQWSLTGQSDDIDKPLLLAYAQRLSGTQGNSEAVTPDYVLDHVQNMQALIAEGEAQGVTQLPEFRQAVHQYQGELLMKTLKDGLVEEIAPEEITADDLRAFFEENPQHFALPDRYSVSVLRASDEAAIEILKTVAAGDLDLEAAGGRPGIESMTLTEQPLAALPAAWHPVLTSMEPGSLSQLLPDGERTVLVRLDAVERDRQRSFEDEKKNIRNSIIYNRYRNAWQEAFAKLRERHGVEVAPETAESFVAEYVRGG